MKLRSGLKAWVAAVEHLGRALEMMSGVRMVHVPYRGNVPALTDLIGGQVHVMFDGIPTSIEHVKSGKLRPLAVTTTTRALRRCLISLL